MDFISLETFQFWVTFLGPWKFNFGILMPFPYRPQWLTRRRITKALIVVPASFATRPAKALASPPAAPMMDKGPFGLYAAIDSLIYLVLANITAFLWTPTRLIFLASSAIVLVGEAILKGGSTIILSLLLVQTQPLVLLAIELAILLLGVSYILSWLLKTYPVDPKKLLLYGILAALFFGSSADVIKFLETVRSSVAEDAFMSIPTGYEGLDPNTTPIDYIGSAPSQPTSFDEAIAICEAVPSDQSILCTFQATFFSVSGYNSANNFIPWAYRVGESGIIDFNTNESLEAGDILASYAGATSRNDLTGSTEGVWIDLPSRMLDPDYGIYKVHPSEVRGEGDSDTRNTWIAQAAKGPLIMGGFCIIAPVALIDALVRFAFALAALIIYLSSPIAFIFSFFLMTEPIFYNLISEYIRLIVRIFIVNIIMALLINLLFHTITLAPALLLPVAGLVMVVSLFFLLPTAISTISGSLSAMTASMASAVGTARPGQAMTSAMMGGAGMVGTAMLMRQGDVTGAMAMAGTTVSQFSPTAGMALSQAAMIKALSDRNQAALQQNNAGQTGTQRGAGEQPPAQSSARGSAPAQSAAPARHIPRDAENIYGKAAVAAAMAVAQQEREATGPITGKIDFNAPETTRRIEAMGDEAAMSFLTGGDAGRQALAEIWRTGSGGNAGGTAEIADAVSTAVANREGSIADTVTSHLQMPTGSLGKHTAAVGSFVESARSAGLDAATTKQLIQEIQAGNTQLSDGLQSSMTRMLASSGAQEKGITQQTLVSSARMLPKVI